MEQRKKKLVKELLSKARTRRETGLYVVDGIRMCREIPVEDAQEVFVTGDFLKSQHAEGLSELLRAKGYTEVTPSEMKQISDTVTPQGILLIAKMQRIKGLPGLLEELSGTSPLLFLLEDIRDPGNLGTIVRTAEAAGADAVLMSRGCVDIYSPKVVRSTMGSLFRVRHLVLDDLAEACRRLREAKFAGGKMRIYAAHLKGASAYDRVDYRGPSAIAVGSEAFGLSDELADAADARILIPMHGQVESLNAAMAASVIAFEAARQRASGS